MMLDSKNNSAIHFLTVLLLFFFVFINGTSYCAQNAKQLEIIDSSRNLKQRDNNLIEYIPNDSIKIMIKPQFIQNSVILITICFVIIFIFISFMIVRSILRKRRNKKIQELVDDRTKSINKEIDKLQQQTDSLKVSNYEAKTLNKELQSESQQLKEINEMILEQNKKIEEQSKKIHQKNELLTQSLNYARRIQHSLFPEISDIKKVLPKTAIFFQPKEIVSGDFYWMHSSEKKTIIAEVDCTGHGVPGAFMSMIGNTLLNEIIINKNIDNPQEILQKLNNELLFIFSHDDFDDEAQDEGMDLTITVIDKTINKVEIASAMQNFFIISNNEVNVYRGDIFSIGGLISRLKKPVYTTHEFDIVDGMRIIMSSDGFIDQFGGSEKDKYGVDRFYKLLTETSNLTLDDQFNTVKTTFNNWKNNQDQMDDVLILGLEF
jgi:phosphoserine phosphatase RsbU/P